MLDGDHDNVIDDNFELNKRFIKFTMLMNEKIVQNKRPNITEIIMELKDFLLDLNFKKFKTIIRKYNKDTGTNYKNLYAVCFCRSFFECHFSTKITFKNPKYAVEQSIGIKPEWNIFLDAMYHDSV